MKKVYCYFLICCLLISMLPFNTVEAKQRVRLNRSKLTLDVGMTYKLKVKGTKKKVRWKSSKKSVAIVSKRGLVKAKRKGTVIVTAMIGKRKLLCRIIVKETQIEAPVNTATLMPTEVPVNTVAVTPTEAPVNTMTVTPTEVPANTATLIPTEMPVNTEEVVPTIEPTKTPIIEVTSVILDKTVLEIEVGSSDYISAFINPMNATDQTIIWSSSNENVVTVSDGTITAVATGAAIVTAKAGNCIGVCEVTVMPKSVKNFELEKSEVVMCVGDEYRISSALFPADAECKKISYMSDNDNIASVDEKGNVTGKKIGETYITVNIDGITKKCHFTIRKSFSYGLLPGEQKIEIGETYIKEFYYYGQGEPNVEMGNWSGCIKAELEKIDEDYKWQLKVTGVLPNNWGASDFDVVAPNNNEYFTMQFRVMGKASKCNLVAEVGGIYNYSMFATKLKIMSCKPTFSDVYNRENKEWEISLKVEINVKLISGVGNCGFKWKLLGEDGTEYGKGSSEFKLSKNGTDKTIIYPLSTKYLEKDGNYYLVFEDYD